MNLLVEEEEDVIPKEEQDKKAEAASEKEVDIPTPQGRRQQRKSINFIYMVVERIQRAFLRP